MFELDKEFALSKATAKIGDTISDGRVTIIIESGSVGSWGEYPFITWSGPALTKKMAPRKDGSIGYIRDDSTQEIKQVS